MSFLQNILTNIEAHSTLVTEAMSVAETKMAAVATAATTAAETAIQNDPLIGQIETAFGTLQTNVQAFIAKHKL